MWLQQFARLEPHEDLVDFLHALVGFCEEEQEQSDDEMETVPKSGTRTRKKSLFTLPKGVNGVIIGGVFKILISRVAEMNFFDLKNLVSVTVYSIEYFIVNYYHWIRDFFEFVCLTRLLFHLMENGSKEFVIIISCSVTQTVQLDHS